MNWEEKASVELRDHFANGVFTAGDAVALLGGHYRAGTVYRLLNDLARGGSMTKLGRGMYRAGPREAGIKTAGVNLTLELEKVRKLLSDSGAEFMITGYSVLGSFLHLFPRRVVHLVYVKVGGGETAAEALEKAGFKVLLNPKSEREVSSALNLVKGDLFVVREKRELYGTAGHGVASIERAVVDLYFESTRARIPFSEAEAGRILLNVIKRGKVDLARMTKIASRRGVDRELRAILSAEGDLPPHFGKSVINEHVKAVVTDRGR